jgi:peptidyl-prolyl cis-trans isomerase SurA
MRFLFAILVVTILTGFGFTAKAELVDGIDSIVHDSIITYVEVEDASENMVKQLRMQYDNQPAVLQKQLDNAFQETRDELQQRQLIIHDFETAGYNLPESIIDEQFENYIKEKYHGDRVAFIKTLQEEGITLEKARRDYRDTFVVEQMRYKNISSAIMISPHKIETYYVDHKDDFKEEDKVKLRMIVLTNAPETDTTETRKLAEEILGKLNEGASFADMAGIYSQTRPQSQQDWVEKSVLRDELADAVSKLKAGEHSGIIETPGAFYILLVEDKKEARVKPLPEVRDQIEKLLLAKERTRLQQAWIAKLKKKTFLREFPY